MLISLEKIKEALQYGLLSFPITDMDENGKFNPKAYVDRLDWFVEHGISAVFVAGGTGEFNSLSAVEYKELVEIAASTVNGRVPVFSGAGRTIAEAVEFE